MNSSNSWSVKYIRQLKSLEQSNSDSDSYIEDGNLAAEPYSISNNFENKESYESDEESFKDNLSVDELHGEDSDSNSHDGESIGETKLGDHSGRDDFKIEAIGCVDDDENLSFHTERIPKPPFRLIMVAQSHSGKTTCVMNMITKPSMYGSYFGNRIHIFSRNILSDAAFMCLNEEILGNSWDGYLPHLLEDIYDKQKKLVEEEGKTLSNTKLIILDDVISDIYSRNKPSVLSTMFMMCRHVNISIILTSQQYKLLPKPIRVNCSSLICFRIHNNEELRNIFNEHGGVLSYKQFEIILSHCWQGRYSFMYCELANSTPMYRFRCNFDKPMNVMEMLSNTKESY